MSTSADEGVIDSGRPRSLWRNSDFLLLWSGQAVSTTGTQVSSLALPLLVLALLHSPAQAGFIAAPRAVPYLVFSLPAGALIDRWDRKRVMILCDAARCLVYGSVPLAYALGRLTLVHLYAVALIEGTAFVFFNIAEVACLPRVVSAEHLPHANALNQSGEAAGYILGPGLGGFLIGLARTTVAGAMLAYAADAVSYLVSVASLSVIRTPFQGDRTRGAARSLRAEIAEGVRFLGAHARLRTLAALTLSINVLFGPLTLVLVVLLRDDLHADPRTIGLLFSLSSGGALAGAAVAPWAKGRLGFGQIIIGTTLLQAVGVAIIAVAGSPPVIVVGGAFVFFTDPISNVASRSYRLSLIPDALQGRVNSVYRLFALGGTPLGTAVGGVLLGPLGPRVELWIIASGVALSALAVGFTDVRQA